MLAALTLLFDTGCLVLIWLVQLIIYPSFTYVQVSQSTLWHSKYTLRISCVVIPLMFGQLICSGIHAFHAVSIAAIIKLVLIAGVWLITFTTFVPLHQKLGYREKYFERVHLLIKRNWIRTALWTLIFVLSVMENAIP